MSLRLADHWVWDSWLIEDGVDYHLFFLRASRALHDPFRRHRRASIGHATSTDLRNWRLLPDALVHADAPSWDDLATWTGSVIRGSDGVWRMYYTGLSHAEHGFVQRIGVAHSDDLVTWRQPDGPLLEADPQWYEPLDLDSWSEEAWRDPYVFADPDGDGWHMLITARVPDGNPIGRGVIGHARSPDLEAWEVQPPLSEPAGFGQLEVPQVCVVDDQPVLVFSCLSIHQDPARLDGPPDGGVYVVPGKTLLGPWDLVDAVSVDHPSLYAGRLVRDRSGRWVLFGFRDTEEDGFVGEIADPIPVILDEGRVRIGRGAGYQGGGVNNAPRAAE